jgi:GT2 family glycosyltransferase
MARPAVSVVVPFAGPARELSQLLERLSRLTRRPGDELIVADNRRAARSVNHPTAGASSVGSLAIVSADGLRTPAFARNCGARAASGEWLIFIDADTRPSASLLDAYFESEPAPSTAILAGGIRDVAERGTLTARHIVGRGHMDQRMTLDKPRPYAQTANCAVRRSAFEAVGGFVATARAGEDADLCFRLEDAGWAMEERPRAWVEHRARDRLTSLLAQLARHGSGAAWCERRHPGSFPASDLRDVLARLSHDATDGVSRLLGGQPEAAGFAMLGALESCAFELGRLVPNVRRDRILRVGHER